MICGSRLLLGAAAALLAVTPVRSAAAAPHPRSGEWWFSAWGIERNVWPQTRGRGVTVAVLDTGVNASLPELSGAVLKGGDSANGKTDGRADLDEREGGHGTGMAALIAGQGGGNTGYVGIAPEAKILPIHDSLELGDKHDFFESLSAGIRFAADHGAKVINISQGANSETMKNHCEPSVQSAVAYAIHHDVVVVASAGNTGNTTNWAELPASCPGVLAVGAIGPSLSPWKGTQRQPYVAVSAPGDRGPLMGKHGELFPNSWGTSISAALTSGAVALIRSRNPRMPARTVVQRLIATAHPLGKSRWNDQTGYGAIQITAAMNPDRYPVAADAPNPVYVSFDKWRSSKYGSVSTPSPVARAERTRAHGSRLPWIVTGVVGALLIISSAIAVVALRRRRARFSFSVNGHQGSRPER